MDYSPEQIEEMRGIVAEADYQKQVAAYGARKAAMAPVTNLVDSEAYKTVEAALQTLALRNSDFDDTFGAHIRALSEIMPRLTEAATIRVAQPAPIAPVVPAEEPEAEPAPSTPPAA